jgi:DNA-binding transcriptional LysR family regulator
VAETENVSRAAFKLHVSQPGVSRQIRDLEAEIGFQLFQRGARSLRLTEAGRALLASARVLLRQAESAVTAARAVAEGAPAEIQVGYAPSLTVQILPQALRKFQEKFPRVRVVMHDLSTEEMLAQLRAGKINVGLMVRPTPRMLRGLAFKELARYPFRVAMAPTHRLAAAKSLSLAQIAREPLLAYSRKEYPEAHEQLAAIFAAERLKPRVAEEYDGVTALIAAIESGRGLALMPSLIVCMVGARLRLAPLKGIAPEIIIGAAWKNLTHPPFLEQFIAAAAAVPPLDLSKTQRRIPREV